MFVFFGYKILVDEPGNIFKRIFEITNILYKNSRLRITLKAAVNKQQIMVNKQLQIVNG